MIKQIAVAASLFATATVATAQSPGGPGAACTAGTHFASIRHNLIKDGKWDVFASAVADHQAWYTAHGDATQNRLARVIMLSPTGPSLSPTEAVTITVYGDKPVPAHDDAYAAFIAKYRDSSTMKDEVRVCLPEMK